MTLADTRSQTIRARLGCAGTAESNQETVWSEQNLWEMFPAPYLIHAKKN